MMLSTKDLLPSVSLINTYPPCTVLSVVYLIYEAEIRCCRLRNPYAEIISLIDAIPPASKDLVYTREDTPLFL